MRINDDELSACPGLGCQKLARTLVAIAAEEARERLPEDRFRTFQRSEERCGRLELHGVDVAQDLFGAQSLVRVQHGNTLAEPWPENGMRKVRRRLRGGANAVQRRHVAGSEAGELRQDVPNPVSALSSGAQFRERGFVVPLLSVQKALQIVWVGVHRAAITGALR
jgi:hypothetical protein